MAKNPKKSVDVVAQGFETDIDKLVKIEFETINGKPFLGQISDDELIYVWITVFNRSIDELFGVTSTRTLTRNVRATYKLKNAIKLTDLNNGSGPNFSYEKFLDDGASENITGRIIGYGASKPVEFGEIGKITVKTNFGVEAAGVLSWLKLYGSVAQQGNFTINKTTGLRTDVFETEIALDRHVEEYLPMFGQKVQVNYTGIPRMCNRCYKQGHLRRECNNIKVDWIEYVNSFVENGIKVELIGSWRNALARWKNANGIPVKE